MQTNADQVRTSSKPSNESWLIAISSLLQDKAGAPTGGNTSIIAYQVRLQKLPTQEDQFDLNQSNQSNNDMNCLPIVISREVLIEKKF